MTRRRVIWGILLLAALLRLPGLWTDFWLDEIWSWTLVWDLKLQSRIGGVWDIFTQIHQDNNNYVNTLFLYLCGPSAALAVYRIPAFLAGMATVWLGGWLVVRWTQGRELSEPTALLVGMGLLATSQVEVVYSSEARGYALAGCAALATQWCLGALLKSGQWRIAVAYALIASAGFLSHLSFLPVFLAHVVWSLAAIIWRRHTAGSWKLLLVKLTIAFGIPALLVGWLWLVDLSQAKVGGGPELQPWLVACDTFSMPWGASLPEWCSLPCALLMVGLLITGLWSLRRAANLEIVSLASLTIIAPAVLFGLAPDGLVYPRHFLVSLSLLIPIAGVGIAHWLAAERNLIRLAGMVAVGVWCLGNGSELVRFYEAGRGQYQTALDHITAGSSGRLTAVGGDFDFRNSMVMTFYQARSKKYQSLRYLPQQAWNQYRPDWIIAHDQTRDSQFPKEIQALGLTYTLDGTFPYAGPVGWHWATYKLTTP
ncbi:MAG: hypothetical protein V4719_31350 [Planctomycetota bacterium]